MDIIFGIDLGTTNSEVAMIRDNEIVVLEKDGVKLFPSVVGMDPGGNLLVGHAARNQAVLYPERTVKSIKRRMGEDVRIPLGDRDYSPPEISAMILRTLRAHAEETLGQKVSKAVITVPAFFNDAQREATRLAGELAGWDVVRIINEPTAAALVYGTDPASGETLLVYDLGGGTFDVSVVRVEEGVIEVLASHGDTHLGGDDFDRLLFDHVCDTFKKKTKVDPRQTPTAVSRVLQAVEEAKKRLSTEPFAAVREEFLVEKNGVPLHLDMEIGRNDYEAMILPLLEKTIVCLNDALRDADLRPSDIDRVILVGGASRTPLVHQLLENRMGTIPHGEIDPDLCVAMGAAVQAGLVSGAEVGRVLIDITPHTLGVSAYSDHDGSSYHFVPLIKRNTPVPCSRSEVFGTQTDNQEKVIVEVFQGEAEDVRYNVQIGDFWLKGLSKAPRGNEIVCRFDLDINGILHVSAMEKKTGLQDAITVENALDLRKSGENDRFREHLADFFDDDDGFSSEEDEAGGDEAGTAEEAGDLHLTKQIDSTGLEKGWEKTYAKELTLMQRAMALAPRVPADDAREIENMIGKIVDAMNHRKPDEVFACAGELEDLLYYLEDSV
ncbi:MAG: Hsp70 family protein [Planctomycetaceae bacterium]|nr:Hsp70 family protein [Planctomycetaceae bacterium]